MKYNFRDIVIDSRTGLNPRKNFKLGRGNNYYITIKDIHEGKVIISDKTDRIEDKAIEIIKKRSRIKNGDILFTSIGRIGDTAIVKDKDDTWDVNESVFVFTVNERIITPEYFCLLFETKSVQSYLRMNISGSTFKSVKMNQLEKMIFELPSLEDQKFITETILKSKRIIELRRKQIFELDYLIKSRFVEMFGDPLLNNMGWEVVKLKKLTTAIRSGNTPKGGSQVYVNEGILFFRSQNVWKNRIELDDIAFIDEETHKSMPNSSLKHKDILMTKTGRINTENSSLGRAAMYMGDDDAANVNGHVYLIRLNEKAVKEFVLFIITTLEYRDYIRSVCVGGIDKRQLNKDHIENFPIIMPPREKQEEFVVLWKLVDKLKSSIQQSLDETQKLFDSLMQEYFG